MNYINPDPDKPYGEGILDLLARTPDLFALFDAEDRLRSANPAFCTAYYCDPAGYPFWQDIMRANYHNKRGPVIETEDIEAWLTIAAARRASVPYRSFEAELHGCKWIWITETVSPHGSMLIHASDISLLRRESRALRLELDLARRASWTDPLTGVPNRRYVMERLAGSGLQRMREPHRRRVPLRDIQICVFDAPDLRHQNTLIMTISTKGVDNHAATGSGTGVTTYQWPSSIGDPKETGHARQGF